jgi:small subunit ribosomal protein S16
MGKIRAPYYRIVVADSRTKRDGRAIEEIGKYHPTHEPSVMEVKSDRAQYWLSVGAQPTEQVLAILKVTGDWQKFKGLPGAEGTLRVAGPKVDDKSGFDEAKSVNENEAKTLRAKRGKGGDDKSAAKDSAAKESAAKDKAAADKTVAEKPSGGKASKAGADKAVAEKAEKPSAGKPVEGEKPAEAPAVEGVEA